MSSSTAVIHPHHSQLAKADASNREDESTATEPASFSLPFDPLRVADAIYRWLWAAFLLGSILAVLFGFVASKKFETRHIASAQLIKLAPQNSLRQSEGGDPYTPHEVSIPNMVAMMWSGPVLEGAVTRMEGLMNEGALRAGLSVNPQRNTDIIHVSINSDQDRKTSLVALEAYLGEVLEFSRSIQQHDAGTMAGLLKKEIDQAESEIDRLNAELLAYAKKEDIVDPDKQTDALLGELANHNLRYQEIRLDHETLDLRIGEIEDELAKVSPAAAKLHEAREELAALQLRYTDEHPTLQNALATVRSLELEAEAEIQKPATASQPPRPGENAIAESLYLDLIKLRGEKRALAEQLEKLDEVRLAVGEKLDQLPRKSVELARIRARRVAAETSRNLLAARLREATLVKDSAEGAFRLLSKDRFEDVAVMTPTQKTMLAAGAGFAGGAGLIVFLSVVSIFLSNRIQSADDLKRITKLPVLGHVEAMTLEDPVARKEWAFTTWTRLLPQLRRAESCEAKVCGLLTSHESALPALLAEAAARRGASALLVSRTKTEHSVSLESALDVTERILEVLTERPEKILHIHVEDDWEWNAAQRSQFLDAVNDWTSSSQLVILIELPDPGAPETLLLAENLPNLLWIGKGLEKVAPCSEQTRLYDAAGCSLTGALLEECPTYSLRPLQKLERFQKLAVTAGIALASFLPATHLEAATPVLLGAGDKVNIRFAGEPELSREGVTVGPDGTLTYLQAQAIPAAGLSIDGLRTVLNRELSRYYRNIRITVTPHLFRSQRVYVLGKIVKKGAIQLERPMKVTDVVAAAGGLETGLFQQNTVELADLRRSFLIRGGKRLNVDFEALFFRGDMSQNLSVAAGDYLYFPSANSNEIHVFGNVKMQGTQGLLAHTSVHSAIAQAGGFSEKAYRKRILVIRGSLENPETFVVDMQRTLTARDTGFRLEPKDIVFIADHPWARAEELLGIALDTFCQGTVSSWAGANIGPIINGPLLPQRR